jgi:hypothetical protein
MKGCNAPSGDTRGTLPPEPAGDIPKNDSKMGLNNNANLCVLFTFTIIIYINTIRIPIY